MASSIVTQTEWTLTPWATSPAARYILRQPLPPQPSPAPQNPQQSSDSNTPLGPQYIYTVLYQHNDEIPHDITRIQNNRMVQYVCDDFITAWNHAWQFVISQTRDIWLGEHRQYRREEEDAEGVVHVWSWEVAERLGRSHVWIEKTVLTRSG